MDTHAEAGPSHSSNESLLKRIKHFCKRLFSKNVDKDLQDLMEGRDDSEIPLSADEKELIASAIKFGDIDVNEACVPRSDIVCLLKKDGFNEVANLFKTSGYSRLPVCGKDLDDIVGFVTLKDIFQYVGDSEAFKLKDVMRACTFVPESLPVLSVLGEMRDNAVQMAVVVDEYGGTTGLITVKDIMEELVGDLDDENEQEDGKVAVKLLDGRYQLDARMEIEDLDEDLYKVLGVSGEAEYDTVGGFVLNLAGKVPEEGSYLNLPISGRLFIAQADERRVRKVTYIPA